MNQKLILTIFILLIFHTIGKGQNPAKNINEQIINRAKRAHEHIDSQSINANKSSNHQIIKSTEVAPGVYKINYGEPDKFTPYAFCDESPMTEALKGLPKSKLPFNPELIEIISNDRGCNVSIPLSKEEQLYGFGLQMNSFKQRGLKRRPIVNDSPLNDLGYTHAPVPMYISTSGYAILINTSRYTTFYCRTLQKVKNNDTNMIVVDIPQAKGIEIFIFTGPSMRNAVQRYILFSGGGALPAIWGLGIKYRVKIDFNENNVLKTARYFRENHIPCDVIGLEPGWQTAVYSCSYKWNLQLFPEPQKLIDNLKTMNFHLNLWEHAFTNPTSPLYDKLKDKSGDYLVWNGLVPDFAEKEARDIFGNYHEETFVKHGISGFKLDECDNSNLTKGTETWSFPELSQFPSGIDGEQMHQVFGELYAKTIFSIYNKNNLRTYLDYRSSNAFAASYPASLYSDTYDHKEYIRMITNSGFCGLLWSPELRESGSETELLRRVQTAVLSAQTLVNSWYLQNPPWLQFDVNKNNSNIFLENAKELEALVRTQFNFRMSLIPYLYSAFAKYHFEGIPPFRALIMDYPDDKNSQSIFDEYMIGENILAAPLTGSSDTRKVYLPQGYWYNYNTNERYEGGKTYSVLTSLSQIPIFIKEGCLLPLAEPKDFVNPEKPFEITCKVYGDVASNTSLFEDDGVTFNFEKGNFNWVKLNWNGKEGSISRTGNYKGKLYQIVKWEKILK